MRLTPTEWHIVEMLVRNAGKLVTQRQLLQEVWGPQYEKETNYLRVYLAQIRSKLEPESSSTPLLHHRGPHGLPLRGRFKAAALAAARHPLFVGPDSKPRPRRERSALRNGMRDARPSLEQRWSHSRQHRQRRPAVCRHFLSPEAELAGLDGGRLRPRVPASARQSENVPVSYPRDPTWRLSRQPKGPFAGLFRKPSDGLEPSTPSLPWRVRGGTGVHGRARAITFLLQIGRFEACRSCPLVPARARADVPVSYPRPVVCS